MLKIYQRYAPAAVAPTTAYPLGSIKNDSVPGADDGTPLEKDWGNNVEGFHQALMAEAALTASGTPDTAIASQLLEAVKIVAANVVDIRMRDKFMPVGTYYGNDSDPTNPATLFGFGTWVRVEGRTLMGCDGTGTGTFGTSGAQGGALTHTHTATGTALTLAQLPNVNIGGVVKGGVYDSRSHTGVNGFEEGKGGPDWEATPIPLGGSDQPHTHTINSTSSLPPYRVAYLWRRTA